jgi:hypothetical protein
MNIPEIGYGVEWFKLAQDKVQWRAAVKKLMKL